MEGGGSCAHSQQEQRCRRLSPAQSPVSTLSSATFTALGPVRTEPSLVCSASPHALVVPF